MSGSIHVNLNFLDSWEFFPYKTFPYCRPTLQTNVTLNFSGPVVFERFFINTNLFCIFVIIYPLKEVLYLNKLKFHLPNDD
jgi:hypothetical protein